MTVTSFSFFILIAIGLLIYYIVPKKTQWIILLCLSIGFYLCATTSFTIVLVLLSAIIAYIGTMLIARLRNDAGRSKLTLIICVCACMFNVVLWFVFKGSNIWLLGLKAVSFAFPFFPQLEVSPLLASLGMGYYTLQVIGYILDVYRGKTVPQRNVFKLLLFIIFFPQLTVGPINRYSSLESLFAEHSFSYRNVAFGCQRILWGLYKKLVISDRIAVIVNGIWEGRTTYSFIWVWFAVLLYTFQLYTDFSGCIDIVLGTAELFDIHMEENFRSPFYSESIKQFWQRWHISLSNWLRDYIYIPLGGNRKGKLRKYVNLLLSLLVSGLWHGSVQTILFFGAYLGIVMIISDLAVPTFDRIKTLFRVRTESFSWKLFCRIRTYVLFAIGVMCFSAKGFSDTVFRIKHMFMPTVPLDPWTLFDSTLLNTGTSFRDINIILVGVLYILLVDSIREKYGSAREWMLQQGIVFRWMVWIILLVTIVVLGIYGPDYDAAQFIYQGF